MRLFVPPGHFYSPVVDSGAVDAAELAARSNGPLHEIDMRYDEQLATMARLAPHFADFPSAGKAGFAPRFFLPNDQFSRGDALLLFAFIAEFRPRRIIEVGSGYSSAVILDTVEALDLSAECTFIEPDPHRLKLILRDGDAARVRIIEAPVQSVDLSVFEALEAGDILFLDTSHVAKTGSDVLHEIFEILPRLKPGVIIHFHDIFIGFEYPAPWVLDENRSWNEAYFLRAYLANNSKYAVELHVNSLQPRFPAEFQALAPDYLVDGGSLWLRKAG